MVIYNIIGFFKDLKSDYIRIANYDVEYSDLNVITNSLEHKIKNWFKEHELKTLVKKENTYFIKGDRYSFIYKIVIRNNYQIPKITDFL